NFLLRVSAAIRKYPFTERRDTLNGTERRARRNRASGRQSGNERPVGASLEWRIFRDFVSSAF
ncbi:hypothetical protein J7376_19455, partial [Paracoccus sp. R12_1]|uniref:hypothetical protein n=1 Tax=unclassified Paracoccus (in: a-proteobacteria) TaxID=2688777 RepID=UPI001ADAC370